MKRTPSPHDRLKMPEVTAILGVPKPEVLKLMARGWLKFTTLRGRDGKSKRIVRRGAVEACKARLEA